MRASTIFLLILATFATNANADRWVETVGSAPIVNGAKGLAREYAIRDAMRLATLQSKTYLNSTTVSSNNVLVIDSASLNTSGKFNGVEIVTEWIDDDFLFVRIRANIDENSYTKPSPAAQYRKRVAIVQFDVLHRDQITDIPDVETQLPRELLRRLENSDRFIGIDATQILIRETESSNPETTQRILTIAGQTGSQIVVAGTIRDIGVIPGLAFNDRAVEIEISLYDGISGVRIATQRFSEKVTYTSYQDSRTFNLSRAFFNGSRLGKMIDRMIDTQVTLIMRELQHIPFSARIISINGSDIVFNAGASAKIEVGDTLMAYRVEVDPYRTGNQNSILGYKETPIASLSVLEVQPQFAIGKLEIEGKLYAGDIIRFGY